MHLRTPRTLLAAAALALLLPAVVGVADADPLPPTLLDAAGVTSYAADGSGHSAATVHAAALSAPRVRIDTGRTTVTAVRTALRHPRPGVAVWTGVVPGDERSSITLVRHDGRTTGSLLLDGTPLQLRPVHGRQELIRNATHGLPEEPARMPEGHGRTTVTAAADEPSVIDVLVTATPAVAEETDDVTGLAQLAIEETNTGYADSGIDATVRLAGVEQVDYTESDMDSDLDRVTDPTDGELDEVPRLRDAANADIAVVLGSWGDYCGVSWIDAGPDEAYSMVEADCATGNYSFGHEIGHLYGARHNPEEDDSTDPYPYGHGYLHVDGQNDWRTIMAYDCPDGCPRLDRWSNPELTYDGEPTGTAEVSDNARVLDERRATLAAFR